MTSLAEKILLIGWDAADWKVITPLLDAGKMPNLETLVNNGVMGNLATLSPMLSPMLWTSIATGKRPFKHGILGFAEPDPQSGGIRPVTNLSRTTKAIWNILNQNGKRCNVVGWWPSHPVEPINGVMVSNHYQRAVGALNKPWPMRPGTVHPERLIPHLADIRIHPHELDGEQLLPFVPEAARINQKQDKHLISLAKIIAECSTIHAAATGIIQLEPWDFMAVYYDAIDHFCHGFMRFHPPKQEWIKQEHFDLYKNVVEVSYRFHDMMLGALLSLAGENTTVILMSDHGFHPDHLRPQIIPNEPAGPAAEHRPYGIVVMKGPGIKKDDRVYGATILDIAPTILTLFGLQIGRDMDGKVIAEAFAKQPEIGLIDSWDDVTGDAGTHPIDYPLDPIEAQEAINQLVALGYMESPSEDQSKAVAETIRELRYNLARSYIDANRYVDAEAVLRKLWDIWPDEHRFGVKLLNCYLALGRVIDARLILDKIIVQKKNVTPKARKELEAFIAAMKDKKPEEYSRQEQRQLRKLRAHSSVNIKALAYLQATVLHVEGNYDAALDALQQAATIQSHQLPSVYLKMGEVYLSMKKWADAEKCFCMVLKIDAINAMAQLGLCRSYLGQQQNLQAAAAALRSIGSYFHNPQAHFLYGVALHRCGRIDMAIEALEMALNQNPIFPEAHKRLAFIYGKRLYQPQLEIKHKRLARETQQWIRDFRAGKLADAGASKKLPLLDFEVQVIPTTNRQEDRNLADVITVVTGLPRSGTSMMMQMLKAGGISLLADENRPADNDNPLGYFEYQKTKSLKRDNSWLADAKGKAVKIVAPLMGFLPTCFNYNVIFMERDLAEIVASQNQMLKHHQQTGADLSDTELIYTYSRQLLQIKKMLVEHPRMIILYVDYRHAVENTEDVANTVGDFLNCNPLNKLDMVQVVDTGLYHQRGNNVNNRLG